MLGIGALALSANIVCLALLAKHRDGEVHMRASWIFSANDVIANLGVILSGILVAITSSRVPDLVIGLLIAAVVVRGGLTILREARGHFSKPPSPLQPVSRHDGAHDHPAHQALVFVASPARR